eukprot:TRINITY_DN2886_c0_g4_i4.p1 TRINITY_DN2886_c0_g4~~TRINITY_DN2886_c0_g4_i4.p1  ORF type:complete len:299 (+),score=78.87 TRINITY_DN2886_c0_g4_i4:922-1818(+)
MREVDLAPDDSKIHYVQFFINAGGVANFAWSFRPDVNSSNTDTAGGGATLSPIDVLWVKGTTAFESLAGIGMGEDNAEIERTRISSLHYDHYSTAIRESDDYYLAFRRRTKTPPRMIGSINTVVATPVFDLSQSIGKLETFGEMCFPPSKPAYTVLSTTHSGDADDVLYMSYHYSKRYDFTMALAGAIAAVIFVPFLTFWIVMVCRERQSMLRRKRMQDEENNAPVDPPAPEQQQQAHHQGENDNNNNDNNNNNNLAFNPPVQAQQQPAPPQGQQPQQPPTATITNSNNNNNVDDDWW